MAERTGMGRSLLIGALLGVLAVAVVLAVVLLGFGDVLTGSPEAPGEVLVVAVTHDGGGASLAGVVFVVGSDGEVTPVDPDEQITIPGTTYDRMRDAYAFGGGEAVAAGYAEVTGAEAPEWGVLPAETWVALVDDAGGAQTGVPVEANVFVDDELYSIEEGAQTLSGHELAALSVAAADLEWEASGATALAVTEALATATVQSWETVVEAVDAGDADSSVEGELLGEFGSAFGSQ